MHDHSNFQKGTHSECGGAHLPQTWVWSRAHDTELIHLLESEAEWVVEMAVTDELTESFCALGFKTIKDANDYMAWAALHFFEEHGAVGVDLHLSRCINYRTQFSDLAGLDQEHEDDEDFPH